VQPDPDWYLDNVPAAAMPGRVEPAVLAPAESWRAWWRRQWEYAGRDLPSRIAREQGFVLTTAQLRACGWADHDLRREIRRGTWTAPARGVASPVVVPQDGDRFLGARRRHALASAAASLTRRGQVVSGRSAAILHGLPTLAPPAIPELTVAPPTTMGHRSRAHLYSATLTIDDVTTWYGVPVETVARTIVTLARHDPREGLMAADAALREALVTRTELAETIAAATGWPGVRRAREVVSLASPLAESPLESVVRLALHDDGFPRPELQVEFYDPRHDCTYRVDLLLRDQRLIIEADGRAKYREDELWREKRREARLRALTGHRVERLVWADLTEGNWPEARERLWLACAR
jgi:hypothetical protein